MRAAKSMQWHMAQSKTANNSSISDTRQQKIMTLATSYLSFVHFHVYELQSGWYWAGKGRFYTGRKRTTDHAYNRAIITSTTPHYRTNAMVPLTSSRCSCNFFRLAATTMSTLASLCAVYIMKMIDGNATKSIWSSQYLVWTTHFAFALCGERKLLITA